MFPAHAARRMSPLRTFLRLSWRQKLSIGEALLLSGPVRLALWLLPFRWIAPALGERNATSFLGSPVYPQHLPLIAEVGRALSIVERRVPWEHRCLLQAIVGRIMLARRGVDGTLLLGMNKAPSGEITAHAWVRTGTHTPIGARDDQPFTVVGSYAFGPRYHDRPRSPLATAVRDQ